VLGGYLAAANRGEAVVTLSASRSETLYSITSEPDCSALHAIGDDSRLPANVVRLRASIPGVPEDRLGQYRFEWSLPDPNVGTLAADLDIGPSEENPAVRGMCSEFGSACVLTQGTVRFYTEPTILWIAPGCTFPKDPTRPSRGGVVRVKVKAFQGKGRLGKGRISLGYGRIASLTLYANSKDGTGARNGIPSDLNPFFSATLTPQAPLPQVKQFVFDSGEGSREVATPGSCAGEPYDACATDLLYEQGGTFAATVQAEFEDDSSICDNVPVRIGTSPNVIQLRVSATPRRTTYVPGDPARGTVNLRVSARNVSDPAVARGVILLTGSNFLSCEAEIEVGGTTTTKTTSFDLQHCSITSDQPCKVDNDCARGGGCPDCQPNEVCLARSHCSTTFTQSCAFDSDCRQPRCATCGTDETCTRVLSTSAITVAIGESVELLNETVTLDNRLPAVAKITDVWTVNPFNAPTDSAELTYQIRGTPRAARTPRGR
jgi:hypothetical protein